MKHIKILIEPEKGLTLQQTRFVKLRGLVYKLIEHDPALSEELHDKTQQGKAAIKLFCFSDLCGQRDERTGYLHVSNTPFVFEIRSADDRIAETIAKRVVQNSLLQLGSFSFRALSYELGTRGFISNTAVFHVKNGVSVYKTAGKLRRYASPDEPEFGALVKNNLLHKYHDVFGREYDGDFDFECIKKTGKAVINYPAVAKAADEAAFATDKSGKIEGYSGEFLMRAEPDMLQIAYYCGIGAKTPLGFGFAEAGTRR